MLKLFSGNAASSTRALPVAAVAWLVSAVASAAPPDAAPLPEPFARYQKWAEERVADWRAANARVGEIGGWRTYARESGGAAADGDTDEVKPKPHGDGHE